MTTKSQTTAKPILESKKTLLREYGWFFGQRDPRLNTDYPGEYMVSEPFDVSELPTKDGRDGPWCIVGDDLDDLILRAADTLESLIE
jgi:hypothetical protein